MTQPLPQYETARDRYHAAPIGSPDEADAFEEMEEALFADQIKQLTHRDGRNTYGGSE